MTLQAPPGKSLVARHSANTTALRGSRSEATTITALPLTSGGSTAVTSPSRAGSSGAITPITPFGSEVEKLKCGPETGLRADAIATYLSHQPAYQTVRS